MRHMIAIQVLLLLLVGWMSVSAIQWQGPENFPQLGVVFLGVPAVIVQCVCGIIVWNRTSGNVEDGDGLTRGLSAGIPLIGLMLAFAALY